jgi:hypothetical protein
MYLVAIAWIYVVLMMAVAEATNTNGSALGAVVTFLLYGVLPLSIVMYLLNTPSRRRRARAAQAQAPAAESEAIAPDQSHHAAGDPVAPVGKEP